MGRKNPLLIVDGYEFRCEKKGPKGTFWTCLAGPKSKCKSRIITKENVVFLRSFHNHEAKELDLRNMSSKFVKIMRNF